MDNNSLAHTKWECEYHLVFAPFCSLGEVGGVGAEPPQKLLAAAVIVQIVGTGIERGLFSVGTYAILEEVK